MKEIQGQTVVMDVVNQKQQQQQNGNSIQAENGHGEASNGKKAAAAGSENGKRAVRYEES